MDTVTQPLQILLAKFINALPGLISALVIFIITIYLSSLISRAVRKALAARNVNPQAIPLLSKMAYWTVLLLGTITALQQVNFNLTAFLTGLGVVGFTIGFALQDVSKNFVSGILMLIQQPFNIGDAIQVTGYSGTVIKIDLRATELHTFDGQVVLIPNADIYTNPITNYSRATSRRVEIDTGVAYNSNLEQVRRTALDAIANLEGLLKDPAPSLYFQNFGNSSIGLTIYYWIDTQKTDPLTAKDAGLIAIQNAFSAAQIDMPFPIQTVYLRQENDLQDNPSSMPS
jgi:small conductance mechanosensitive channel